MNVRKVSDVRQELTVYLPDTRGVHLSRWGKGNLKLGMDGLYSYSRLPGRAEGTCPGATDTCWDICYARRVQKTPLVWDMWTRNSGCATLPWSLPPDAKVIRMHVSGDFDNYGYILNWIALAKRNPDVRFFGYTRSWRVPELLRPLERLRALPNVQLFASIDQDTLLPPEGWRRAWLKGDPRLLDIGSMHLRAFTGPHHDMNHDLAYVCPAETGRKKDCLDCNFCILGTRNDVVFSIH